MKLQERASDFLLSSARSLATRLGADSVAKRAKDLYRFRPYYDAVAGRTANLNSIAERLRRSYRPVTAPLVMISQVERSGGSLMAQLFDGHPDLLAHPHELKFGYPDKRTWPPTDIPDAGDQFRTLFELNNIEFCEAGYTKGQHNPDRLNFFLVPYLQKEIFGAAMEAAPNRTARDVLNAYFTSYFNAWLNMRARIEQPKFVTGFVPMMAAEERNMDAFWEAYPDGYLVSVLRSPLSWHPSFLKLKAKPKTPSYSDVKVTSARWNASTQAVFRERQRNKERVIVISFEDLLGTPEATMRHVCSRLGLDYHPTLISPTFNGEPMASNSIFGATARGVVTSAPAERQALIHDEQREYLQQHSVPLYERALAEIVEKI